MGISSSMYVALSGMHMSQAGMEVASHNIANVNTPGYSRQRLNLETMPTWKTGYGQMGTGVNAQNISRFHDQFLARSIVTKSSEYGYAAAQKATIDALESFFNESNGNGINAALNAFWDNWDNVAIANADEQDPTREALVGMVQTLADQLNMRRSDMDAVRQDLNDRVSNAVDDINGLIKGIADLNQQIMRSEDPERNQQANDLRDTRDALVTQLGELIDIDYWEDPLGAVDISFFSGPALVMGDTAYEVGAETDESGDVHVIANNRRNCPPWPEDVTEKIDGGAVGGWIEFRDVKMRDFYLKYESFVDELIFQVNNQHAQGVGLDLFEDAVTGGSLVSNLPSQTFSFDGRNNDLKLSALVPHIDAKEPYSPKTDPENISIRFVKSTDPTKDVSSTVEWNDDPAVKKWEITITLPTDSNGNVTATAEDVIRHINTERSQSPTRGVATLPPVSMTWPYKIGDFISAESAPGNDWSGKLNFNGYSSPSGIDHYTSLDRSLANVMKQGQHLSYGSENARLSTNLKHTDNDVLFTALQPGAAGEKVAIEYVNNGPNQALGVSVTTDPESGARTVSVSLATDADGN
ncbi:MAG: flagellar hook-associated protein FlgK, partial [Candidatus Adiutrix sp.]|nr:flagellar hook-associated protein FlgK [Candidatus Adiutrix sp.]